MRKLIALAVLALAPAAHAAENCGDLSAAMHLLDASFPEVASGSEIQLVTWRASCAENPPAGAGNVSMLCEAETDGKPVFFWVKDAGDHQTVGYASCP